MNLGAVQSQPTGARWQQVLDVVVSKVRARIMTKVIDHWCRYLSAVSSGRTCHWCLGLGPYLAR
jgi:hypothetical protein